MYCPATTMASETVHIESATYHDEISPEALGTRKDYTNPQFIGTLLVHHYFQSLLGVNEADEKF